MRRQPKSRPQNFWIDQRHPLWKGNVFAGLGWQAKSNVYHDGDGRPGRVKNDGTLTNMVPAEDWVFAPQLGRWALDFDGNNDYVVTDLNVAVLGSVYSAAWWGRVNAIGNVHVFWSFGTHIAVNVGATDWRWQTADSSGTAIKSTIARASGVWNHYAIVSSGTSAGQTRLYTNGVEQDDDGDIAALGTTYVLNLGWQSAGANTRYLLGADSDVMFYNRVLSDAEINAFAQPGNVMLSIGGNDLLRYRPSRSRVYMSGGAPGIRFSPWITKTRRQRIGA